tara:strand:- start:90 stop:233 length:144 start_codon:yes stop_codon:yes gene_type:complete
MDMKSKYFENSLAVLGAVLIIVAVWASADSALAGDLGTVEFHYSAQR